MNLNIFGGRVKEANDSPAGVTVGNLLDTIGADALQNLIDTETARRAGIAEQAEQERRAALELARETQRKAQLAERRAVIEPKLQAAQGEIAELLSQYRATRENLIGIAGAINAAIIRHGRLHNELTAAFDLAPGELRLWSRPHRWSDRDGLTRVELEQAAEQ